MGKIRRERLRLLVECRAVSLLLVRRGGLRAGAGADALGAWVVLHDMRARFLVWLRLERRLRSLFIYSKIAELMDTVLLLLAGKPVIALQWWHHSTVLLYCWHSYSVRIATGAWFACMNYSVHSIMYG